MLLQQDAVSSRIPFAEEAGAEIGREAAQRVARFAPARRVDVGRYNRIGRRASLGEDLTFRVDDQASSTPKRYYYIEEVICRPCPEGGEARILSGHRCAP